MILENGCYPILFFLVFFFNKSIVAVVMAIRRLLISVATATATECSMSSVLSIFFGMQKNAKTRRMSPHSLKSEVRPVF